MYLMIIQQLILSPQAISKFYKQDEWVLASMLSLCGRMSLFSCKIFSMKNEFYYIKQGKFDEFISPTKGYLRETCKSQNINPIYLTLSSPTVSFKS